MYSLYVKHRPYSMSNDKLLNPMQNVGLLLEHFTKKYILHAFIRRTNLKYAIGI